MGGWGRVSAFSDVTELDAYKTENSRRVKSLRPCVKRSSLHPNMKTNQSAQPKLFLTYVPHQPRFYCSLFSGAHVLNAIPSQNAPYRVYRKRRHTNPGYVNTECRPLSVITSELLQSQESRRAFHRHSKAGKLGGSREGSSVRLTCTTFRI